MEGYEFKVKGPKEKCLKIFLKAEEVKMLESVSHGERTLTRFRSPHGWRNWAWNIQIESPADGYL